MKTYKLNLFSKYLDSYSAKRVRDASNKESLDMVLKLIPNQVSVAVDSNTGKRIGELFENVKIFSLAKKIPEARRAITTLLKALSDLKNKNIGLKPLINSGKINTTLQELSHNLDPDSHEAKKRSRSAGHTKEKLLGLENPSKKLVETPYKGQPKALTTRSISGEMDRFANTVPGKVQGKTVKNRQYYRRPTEEESDQRYVGKTSAMYKAEQERLKKLRNKKDSGYMTNPICYADARCYDALDDKSRFEISSNMLTKSILTLSEVGEPELRDRVMGIQHKLGKIPLDRVKQNLSMIMKLIQKSSQSYQNGEDKRLLNNSIVALREARDILPK